MPEYSIVEGLLQLGGKIRNIADCVTGEVLDVSPLGATAGGSRVSGGVPAECAEAGGLSTAHISPQAENEWFDFPKSDEEKNEACFIGYVGGSLIQAKHTGPFGEKFGGGKRGKIKGFSPGARRRFIRKMATIKRDQVPVFVTLTYPDSFPFEPSTWAKHLDTFRKRIARKGLGAIWRKELQVRKSGENAGKIAPHFHLMVWGASKAELMSWIPAAWYKIVGSGDERHLRAGTRVEELRSYQGAMAYVSKYMAKVEDMPVLEGGKLASIGRLWGVINSAAVPWADLVRVSVDDKTVNTFFRMMRRYAKMRARSWWPSMTVLCNDPWQWLRATELL